MAINNTFPGRSIRYLLGILLLFVAIGAFGGGYYGMTGAKGIPVKWLDGSPFDNYFLPALILFIIVGGMAFVACILVFMRHKMAIRAAFGAGIIIIGWIVVQLAIIGYVSWLQPTMIVIAVFIILLAWLTIEYEH
jgi:uncharacterized BrkB/YihY/UPF0761 family membrane protein